MVRQVPVQYSIPSMWMVICIRRMDIELKNIDSCENIAFRIAFTSIYRTKADMTDKLEYLYDDNIDDIISIAYN